MFVVVLLGIEDGQAAHSRGVPQLEERRAVFLVAPAGGEDDRTLERLAPDGRLHHTFKVCTGRNAEAALDEVTGRGQQHFPAGLRRLIEGVLDRGGVIGGTIGPGAEGRDGNTLPAGR